MKRKKYKIIRFHRYKDNEVVKTGLTLRQAQKWCTSESTHSFDSKGDVIWFDGYTEEDL